MKKQAELDLKCVELGEPKKMKRYQGDHMSGKRGRAFGNQIKGRGK